MGIAGCMLLHAKLNNDTNKLSDSRNQLSDSLRNLDFACRLWGLFMALISDAISNISTLSAKESENIMEKNNEEVTSFFNQVM